MLSFSQALKSVIDFQNERMCHHVCRHILNRVICSCQLCSAGQRYQGSGDCNTRRMTDKHRAQQLRAVLNTGLPAFFNQNKKVTVAAMTSDLGGNLIKVSD